MYLLLLTNSFHVKKGNENSTSSKDKAAVTTIAKPRAKRGQFLSQDFSSSNYP